MNISKLEEILNTYENQIDDLENKFLELMESCYEDTYDSNFVLSHLPNLTVFNR